MPAYTSTPNLAQRIVRLERELAQLRRRSAPLRDEVPVFPTSLQGMPAIDDTSFVTAWETILAPRTATLSVGLVFIGDQVGGTNTGGAWRVLLNSNVVMSGTVTATFSYQFAAQDLPLAAYADVTDLKLEIQVRRTSGATTGGRWGFGGSIMIAPRYVRLL